MRGANKIRIVKVWEILRQNTDAMNPMSTSQILKKLAEAGIVTTRQAVYEDIKVLNVHGYEVICQRHTVNEYYIADSSFTLPEIQILLDAVQAANFITPRKTEALVNKIIALGGSYKDEAMQNNIVFYNTTKHTNESIYYNINELIHAIVTQKKASFFYFDYNVKKEKVYRKEKRTYIENPCALVFSADNYYLVAYNEKHDSVIHYRIDRMENVQVSAEDAILPDSFDIQRHKSELFGMFTGKSQSVLLEAEMSMLDVIFDRFGESVDFLPAGEGKIRFRARVQISPQFLSWVCSFGRKLKVLEPASVIEDIKESLLEVSSLYS